MTILEHDTRVGTPWLTERFLVRACLIVGTDQPEDAACVANTSLERVRFCDGTIFAALIKNIFSEERDKLPKDFGIMWREQIAGRLHCSCLRPADKVAAFLLIFQ